MYDVLEGIRVVELGEWVFVPSAATILSDWGADVIKVEHPVTGDAVRGLANAFTSGPINAMLEITNRGKRSIGVDLSTAQGRELLDELLDTADVFVTSFMRDARVKLGLEPADVLARHPRLVYGRGTGHGIRGRHADTAGYDWTSFWARAGLAQRMTPPDGEPPFMPGSLGDLTAGITLAGVVSAALLRRERTGHGSVVDVSLYGVGAWLMCQSVTAAPFGLNDNRPTIQTPFNPLANFYRTQDGRWLSFSLLQGDRWWADLCHHIGRDDLATDSRFADHQSRATHRDECVEQLVETFGSRTYAQWLEALEDFSGPWSPVQSVVEVTEDPQAIENGYVTPVTREGAPPYLGAATPGQFDERPVGELHGAPEHGQHTEEILLELGHDWDEIGRLKDAGAVL